MRAFTNVGEMVKEVEREIFEMGTNNHPQTYQDKDIAALDDYDTKELLGYSYGLSSWKDKDSVFLASNNESVRDEGLSYCLCEFDERVSGQSFNPGEAFRLREELWSKFLEEDGCFSYTYSSRMHDQLEKVVNELIANPGSRQCIITLYDKHEDLDNLGGKRRIPCSMHYQFLQRNIGGQRSLSLIYTMRSCDFYNHFPIDVYLGLCLLEWVAEQINATPVNFIHFMGSLHAYKKDFIYRRIF